MRRQAYFSETVIFLLLFFFSGLLFSQWSMWVEHSVPPLPTAAEEAACTVILDAGHGGEDGGAIGVNGVLEKDINLAIATELAQRLEEEGIHVILTRTDDRLLYKEEENIKGQRKLHDLKNRLAVAEAHPKAIFVSIHMNAHPLESCRGMQIYYAPTEGSRLLASSIQKTVKNTLQPYNKRQIQASKDLYLLDHAVGTAILIECGFLSNVTECSDLTSKVFQRELSFQIFCGMMEYINQEVGGV